MAERLTDDLTELSLAEARRIALAAQGLTGPRPSGPVDASRLLALVERLALLQLDFVNVVVPSHYLVPWSRLGDYDRGLLDALGAAGGGLTEQWAREASLVPMDAWPLLAHRRAGHEPRPAGFARFLEERPDYVELVRAAVRERGPLAASGLPSPAGTPRRLGHAWFGSVPRAVLEALFGRGELAIAGRGQGFARLYDLAERLVPREHRAREIAVEEAQRELLRRAARALGVATAGDLADALRLSVGETRPRLAELVAQGGLRPVRVAGWREIAYLHPGAAAHPGRLAALLSPFDPLVACRARALRLFDFDYRFEIFVPASERRWGAYVLPFLLGERLVARVDLKAEREAGRLAVLGAWAEAETDPDEIAGPLAAELRALAAWLGLAAVRIGRRGNLARALRPARTTRL